jgi:hypothetical protein
MSKVSRRPNREDIKEQRRKQKQACKALRRQQRTEGLVPLERIHISNSMNKYESVEEEKQNRIDSTVEQAKILRAKLPALLKRLKKIPDPRNPKKTKHKLTVLVIYGILIFIYQMASRREANREMTRPMFMKNLQLLFPELETIPHSDTLMRLLSGIDVSEIEQAHIELIRRLIKNKKFHRYLIDNCYPIAIDGTQKFVRDNIWCEQCSERTVGKGEDARPQYYVYVLEASMAFHNGMVIPLLSEFLDYTEGDTDEKKEDCETKAFKRLAVRLKVEFKRLRIMILLDGLYPNGPIMEICRKNKWDFMIVLKDKSLRSVWEEYYGLKQLQTENRMKMKWGDRRQKFEWVNEIEYYYGPNQKKKITLHVVTCVESWKDVDKSSGEIVVKTSRHAWISNKPLTKENIHERCNLAARHRWGIESNILVEKCHGYKYEHCFSYNWNAMQGYHYLMRLAHLINVLAEYSESLVLYMKELGIRGFIHFVRSTISGPWLSYDIRMRLMAPFQLRLL